MGCATCGDNAPSTVQMPCGVCRELSNDSSVKAVWWCQLCGEYVCLKHKNNYVARGAAAITKGVKFVVAKI